MNYPVYNINEIALIKCSRSGSRSTSGIINNKLTFEELITPQQCAEYFGLNYKGLVSIEEGGEYDDDSLHLSFYATDKKVHLFTDPNNEDCKLYVWDDMLDAEYGRLKNRHFDSEVEYIINDDRYDDEDMEYLITNATYPLRQFFKDYNDLPPNLKKCLSNVAFVNYDEDASGRMIATENGKSLVLLFESAISGETYPRGVMYHEVGHSISHKLGYDNKFGAFFDIEASYIAKNSKYKKAKKEDKKLNGDQWATSYGQSSRRNDEEQADVSMAILLNATKDKDPLYNKRTMDLSVTDERYEYNDTTISVDEFLERYPNRVRVVKEFMGLD